ncbi:Holliday junction branch migration protein RuvA [Candidatus Phytoplasma pini]|uniref:Holliday junction branch migration complex subunit RuvA n=1 Tax=Candidatus Phytoplasma pini TaxID=267362 RepID=A0A559KJV7_9MOLU|nr:Holliday junction branch migration protein RuvA [Candidatus Phytoplasma pini]TVY12413.1 Holliday junction ATP-dependent DNA helicase RuvA [Candidatus Phytoplasma pini]
MYYYIKGTIKEIKNNIIIVENNQIGYIINFTNPYDLQINQEIKLFTYFYVTENIHALYGFVTVEMLNFFQKLISIPGIGVKSAILMTNIDFFEETQKAIKQSNINYIIKFPGIGKKTAQQIILHLHKNLLNLNKIQKLNKKQEQIQEALINLGFKKTQIGKIIYKLNSSQKLDLMLKEALILIREK